MDGEAADKRQTTLANTSASVNASFSQRTQPTASHSTVNVEIIGEAARTKAQRPVPQRYDADSEADGIAYSGILLYHEWRSGHQFLGRYSVEKLLAFEDYCDNVSALHVAAGVAANGTFYVHSALSYVLMSVGLLLFIRCALGWPNEWYSHKHMVIISFLVCACNEVVFVIIGYSWRFPVPFRDLLGISPYFVFLGIFHVLVVGKTLFLKNQQQLMQYVPLLVVQSSTLFIFQAYAILFEHVSANAQVVLTVCFPLLKTIIMRMTWRFSTCLPDVATDVTVCVAEIFGSMFLNVCIQNVRSPAVGVIIVTIDIAQAVLETHMYMGHKFTVDGRRAVSTAVKIIEGALFPGTLRASSFRHSNLQGFNSLTSKGTSVRLDQTENQPKAISRTRTRSFNKVAIAGSVIDSEPIASLALNNRESNESMVEVETARRSSMTRRGTITVDGIAIDHKEHDKLLTQTLQLMFASEVLSFAEYTEVATAATHALYMLSLFHLPYARFNLSFIGLSSNAFQSSLAVVGVYVVLEAVSLAFMVVQIRHKYGYNALYQIAFVLEKYWMTVQGKFVGSLELIFILNTVHHGMDLTLQFDWERVLNGTTPSI